MKTPYFTSQNISKFSKDLLNSFPVKNNFFCDTPALLVLDMQNYFLHEESHAFVPSSKAIIKQLIDLVRLFDKLNFPIIFTKHINTNENAQNMGTWWKEMITHDHPLSQINSAFNSETRLTIEKAQYDAFFQTDLENILKSDAVTDIIITGVMTHLCCETTARSAFMHGYRVWFPIDGTATYNLDFHLSTLRNLTHGFANILLIDDIQKYLEQRLSIER